MLIVEKFPWANTLDVTRGVEEALDELRPGLSGIDVDHTIFRPASFIEQALHNLSNALILGSVLVFVILIVFLFEWRTALISLVAIPLSLMAAAMVLYVRDVTINTMILAGFVISVGVVVDDAIIDVENITRRLRLARIEGSTRSTASIILDSSLEVRSAIVYATLIDVIAVSPVFFISGLSGSFFQPLVDLLRARRAGIAGRRADGHAGDGLHPAAQRPDRAPALTHHQATAGRLRPR